MKLTDGTIEMFLTSPDDNTRMLAKALQEERAMLKDNVWEGAPDDAVEACIEWRGKDCVFLSMSKSFFRELPKVLPRADELASDAVKHLTDDPKYKLPSNSFQIIRAAILKREEELKGDNQ